MLALFAVLYGLWRGWKNGLSTELLPLSQWIGIIVVGAIVAEPLGGWVSWLTGMALPLASVCAYLSLALALKLLFLAFGGFAPERPSAIGLLGGTEKALAVVSGGLRYSALVLVVVVVLNAFDTQSARQEAGKITQTGRSVPLRFVFLFAAQDEVLARSFVGGWMQQHLDFLLVPPSRLPLPVNLSPRLPGANVDRPEGSVPAVCQSLAAVAVLPAISAETQGCNGAS